MLPEPGAATSAPAGPRTDRRIAVALPNLYGGGAERTLLNLARGLADRGAEVDLVVFMAAGSLVDQVPANVRLVDLGSRRAVRSVGPLRRYLRRRRPEAVISGLDMANLVLLAGRLLLADPPAAIVTVHSGLDRSGPPKSALFRTIGALRRWLYPRADRLVAVSEGVHASIVRVLGTGVTAETIYNPVVHDAMLDAAAEPAPHPWLDDGRGPVVMTAGRLVPIKNHPLLLDAFALLPDALGARLLIFGEGESRPELEARIERMGLGDRVALPGFVANPFAAMARADVFALSSHWEGLPTVIIEALTLGCRVVATDIPGGLREIADRCPAVQVVAQDAEALARGLSEQLGAGSRRAEPCADPTFHERTAVARYLALLETVRG